MAENRVEVVAEGVGECMEVKVEEGDFVEKGQVLAELDKEEAVAALRQLEIQVAQNKTAYEIAEKSLVEGLGAKVERDNAQFAYEQAAASLAAQRLQVDNLTIRAPISGVVTRRNIQEGQMVSTASPVFSLVTPSSYMLEIHPPEKELARLSLGQAARVSIDALGGEEFAASVRRINPSVDPLTGTLKVVLDFDEETRKQLREAAFARVRLVMETHANALMVPKDTLVEENGRKYVFVVEEVEEGEDEENGKSETEESGDAAVEEATEADPADARAAAEQGEEAQADEAETGEEKSPDEKRLIAKRVEVQTGFEDSNRVEILSGIDDDSIIVTLGQHTLKPGARVRITNAKDEIEANADMSAEEALAAAQAERAKGEEGINRRRGRHRQR